MPKMRRKEWSPGRPGRPPAGSGPKEVAELALKYLTTKKRPSGESFVTRTDDAPEWMVEIVRTAHEHMLPDDYKYDYVWNALEAITQYDDPQDAESDIEADVYNADLLAWLQSHGERQGFVDEAVSEFGHSDMGLMGDIMIGQWHEKTTVFRSVLNSVEELAEKLEE